MKRQHKVKHYEIRLGANSDAENLAKLGCIYNKFKARMILKDIEEYPEEMQEEILRKLCCQDTENRRPDKWRDRAENVNIEQSDKEININIVSTKDKKI